MTPDEQARFEALERRVEELERLVRGQSGPPSRPSPASPRGGLPLPSFGAAAPPPAPTREDLPLPSFAAGAPPRAPTGDPVEGAARFAPVPHRELVFGLNWISRIAVITVVLALAFFFEYAFENRWITESGRVLLGVACGLAAFAGGEFFFRRGQRAYGQSLAAAGVAFFYLSFWASFGLYHLLPQLAAFGLMVLTTAMAIFLALRYDSPAVALLGMAGGFATPGLLASGGHHPWFVLNYALVLSAGASAVARARRWAWPEALAVAGTTILYSSQRPAEPFYAVFAVAYYALFVASRTGAVFLAAQVLAPLALATIWAPGETGLVGAWLLTVAGLAIGDRLRRPVAGVFAGFWLAYLVWYWEAGFTPLVVLTAAYAIFLAWPLWRALRRREPLGAADLILLALNAGFYFAACYGLLASAYEPFVGLFAVAVAASQAAAARLLWRADTRGALLSAGAAWVILVLAAPIQFAGYRVTVTWAAEAAAMAWIGARLGERRAVVAAMGLLGVVVLRLAASDAVMYAGPEEYALLANARFLAFAAAAASFWAAAWWMREDRPAAGAYAAGHAVMLWGLALEAIGWAARTASPDNYRSVASTAVSVIAAGYAVLLVGGGAAWRHTASRLMGIGLIGIVVLKLYLYDVWLLGAFYRMAAFAILGVMLLVMSYLYSRRAGRGPAPREP